MNKFICLIILVLFPLTINGQRLTVEETLGWTLNMDIVSNPFSGYKLKEVPFTYTSKGKPERVKIYQVDSNGVLIRQIIMSKDKWPHAPEDLTEKKDGGYRLYAVTPKEYAALSAEDRILGEVFECRAPQYMYDNEILAPVELVCIPYEYESTQYRTMANEIMYYTYNGKDYMSCGRNYWECEAEYTAEKTNGLYNCYMFVPNDKKHLSEWVNRGN